MPPHQLRLKIGSIIMLLRNLNNRRGLCNGARLCVISILPSLIQAQLITGTSSGNIVLIPRIRLKPSDPNLPFILERTQFPVRLAYYTR
jgi:ATP-dependent DNA helicase PIF1